MTEQQVKQSTTVTPTVMIRVLNDLSQFTADLCLCGGNIAGIVGAQNSILAYMSEYGNKYPDQTFTLMYPWEVSISPAGCTTVTTDHIDKLLKHMSIMVEDAPTPNARELAATMKRDFETCLQSNSALISDLETKWRDVSVMAEKELSA